jgi:soluble lytic murein transglycosylase-like protein
VRIRHISGLLAAAALFWMGAPVSAMELVVFRSERSLVVERYEEEGDQVMLTLPGGGAMGIPSSLIENHYPGYVPPLELEKPEEKLPASLPYRDLIAKYCQKYQMDWKLVAAVIRVESNFNPLAVSPKGAQGLMQLMPQTQRELGVKDALQPEENIRGGVQYLKYLLDALHGDLELTLAAYNAGIGRVQAIHAVPNIPETRNYVSKILALYPTL